MKRSILLTAALVAGLAACDDTTGPEGPSTLTISFATVSTDAPLADAGAPLADVTATGTNGTLTINAIWVVVDKFKLEGANDACEPVNDDDEDDDELDDCEELESPPMLVPIPVDGTELDLLTAEIRPGTYTAIEWEVEDIELDDDDEEETELETVRADIEEVFGPGVWPDEASMAVQGSFLADGAAEAESFTTFFDAEIEVEMVIDPPLVITDEGANRELKVNFAPQSWFTLENGTVVNLAAASGEVMEFELEFEDGIVEIEHDDDEDHDLEDDDDHDEDDEHDD